MQNNQTTNEDKYLQTILESSQYEKAVIGCLLLRPRGFFEITWVEDIYFSNIENKDVFRAIRNLTLDGKPVDTMSVHSEVKKFNPGISVATMSQYTADVPSATSIEFYASKLRRSFTASKLMETKQRIDEIVNDTRIDNPEDMVGRVLNNFLELSNEIKSSEGNDMGSILDSFEERKSAFAVAKEEGKEILGWSTGFSKYDTATEGLEEGKLTVIGGGTSVGKTAFVLNLLYSLLKQKARCKFISLEMSGVSVVGRLISIISGVESKRYMKSEELTPEENSKIKGAMLGLRSTNLSISDDRSWDRIKLEVIKSAMSGGVDVLFIDYLQLINTREDNLFMSTTIISQGLQQIAKDYKIHIVMLSQLNQEHLRSGRSSTESQGFKGGGGIGESADVSIELVNNDSLEERGQKEDDGKPRSISLIIKKARDGMQGKIALDFYPKLMRFIQTDYGYIEPMERNASSISQLDLPFVNTVDN